MQLLIDVILPVFGVVALGYGATFTPLIDRATGSAISRFAFNIALPIMLFEKLAHSRLPAEQMGGFLLAYFAGAGLTAVLTAALLRLRGVRRLDRGTILVFTATYSNTVLLGIPLVLTAYGDAASLPLFVLITFHGVVFFSIVTLMIELGQGVPGRLVTLPWRTLQALLGNPIFLGLSCGLAANLLELPMPQAVRGAAQLVGQAALPCALFAMGAALRDYRLEGALRTVPLLVVLKLGVQPAFVYALAAPVLGLPDLWVKVATLLAALPTGINVFLLASRYRAGEAESAAGILLTTSLSVVTLSVVLHLLG